MALGWGKYRGRKLRNHDLEVEVYTNEYVRVGDNASAEGTKLRLPKARSPFRLGGLGERRKLPRNRRDFEHFMPNGMGGDLGNWGTVPPKFEVGTAQASVPPIF